MMQRTSLTRPAASLAVLTSALLLAGCMGGSGQLRPLPPVPTTSVAATALPDPVTFTPEPAIESQSLDAAAGIDGTLGPGGTLGPDGTVQSAALPGAALEPPAGATAVSEDDLIGAWSAATPSATCAINLSLTTWEGGYRASTRNCADVQISTLAAWSVEGQQVILKGANGAPLARLFRTGPTRYAGQTETGQALTVFR